MLRLALLIMFVSSSLSAQDYRVYHRYINNAERCFFMEKKVDSAYRYYDSAFAKFDFVFAKDCFMAAQIAYSRKNSKYISYLRKGFQNGLRPNHLKMSKVFRGLTADSIALMRNFPDYAELRKHYLKRISVFTLKKMMEHQCVDQTEKHNRGAKYVETLTPHIRYYESLAVSGLFPGDKLIGIDQIDIMKELGYEHADYKDYYERICKHPADKRMTMDLSGIDDRLSVDVSFAILLHHPCIFWIFANYWDKLIANGQIHPRDIAVIYDFQLWARGDREAEKECSCPKTREDVFFDVGDGFKPDIANNKRAADSMRAKYYICPLAQDIARRKFGKDSGFAVVFGYGWNR